VSWSAQQQRWVIEPLVLAGVGLDRIGDLLFRLGFDAIVHEDGGAGPMAAAEGEPAEVRAAWRTTVGRLTFLDPPDEWPSAGR